MSSYVLGAHLSVSDGIHMVAAKMEMIGADCCAVFLKNQRTYRFKTISDEAVALFKKNVKNPAVLVPHASYLINLAGKSARLDDARALFTDDLRRCKRLGIELYNIHPGSDVAGVGKDEAIRQVSDEFNAALGDEAFPVTILVENMAGQGSTLCSSFGEIKKLVDGIDHRDRIGVCLDTAHLFGSGYDIRTKESFGAVINEFDRMVGINFLKAMHINDSKVDLGSKKDRHESIGKGKIGIEAFKYIMNSDVFEGIPLVLETPVPDLYRSEIEMLRRMRGSTEF